MELPLPGDRPLAYAAIPNFGSATADSLDINAAHLTSAGPLDLAGIVAISHWAVGLGLKVTLKVPDDHDVTAHVQRMGTLDRVHPDVKILGPRPRCITAKAVPRHLEVTTVNESNDTEISNRLGPMIKDFYEDETVSGGIAVWRACAELLSNATEHGASEVGGFIAAQTYPATATQGPRVEFAVCDTGDGVLARLHLNRKHSYLSRDEQAITQALKRGISGVAELHRGNGLRDVIDDTRQHGKLVFHMRSGRGQVVVAGTPKNTSETPNGRPDDTVGTWASLTHQPGRTG